MRSTRTELSCKPTLACAQAPVQLRCIGLSSQIGRAAAKQEQYMLHALAGVAELLQRARQALCKCLAFMQELLM